MKPRAGRSARRTVKIRWYWLGWNFKRGIERALTPGPGGKSLLLPVVGEDAVCTTADNEAVRGVGRSF